MAPYRVEVATLPSKPPECWAPDLWQCGSQARPGTGGPLGGSERSEGGWALGTTKEVLGSIIDFDVNYGFPRVSSSFSMDLLGFLLGSLSGFYIRISIRISIRFDSDSWSS